MITTQAKKDKIKQTLYATKTRRALMIPKSIECKIDISTLNLITKEQLKLMFLESKW